MLHGFGFAGALSEVGLPPKAIPVALLFFKCGVEVGQVFFIAVVFALAFGARQALQRFPLPNPRWALANPALRDRRGGRFLDSAAHFNHVMRERRKKSEFGMGTKTLVFVLIVLSISVCTAAAQSGTDEPRKQIWVAVNASFELSDRIRVTATAEKHNGEESSGFHQGNLGVVFSYRLKRVGKHLWNDNDKENEYNLILGGGYEFIVTDESGSQKREHRLILQSTPKFVLGLGVLAQDRNRVEFRWNAGTYNFRYRNRLTVERPFKIGKLRLSPYAAGELYWDRNHHAWNENQYAFGVQWSIRKISKLNTYYLRQNCTTCTADPLNIFGVTVNLFFDWPRKK